MYKQIRMLVGTIISMLKKKLINSNNIICFIENKCNKKYVYTAPAHALYLHAE